MLIRFASHLMVVISCLGLLSCTGTGSNSLPSGQFLDGQSSDGSWAGTDTNTWPVALPEDAVQPWETTDAAGNVLPANRLASGINADSQVAAGIEWQATSPVGVSDYYDASRLTSGDVGGNGLSWATYRLPLGGTQPGAVSLDVNLLPMDNGESSVYWVGLADYAAGCWEWHGPYSDHHGRLSTAAAAAAGADYLSTVGSLFVCVVAHDGATCDVVCVGANPITPGDSTPPAAPANLAATPTGGALFLTWDGVTDANLAGYRMYYSTTAFALKDDSNVQTVEALVGYPYYILPVTVETWVAVSAVDVSGNESALSNITPAAPLTGEPPQLVIDASQPSGLVHCNLTVTATGADSYNWDLDGDGVFEIIDDTTGLQSAYTGRVGVTRVAVTGSGSSGGLAGGGVSLLLGTNSRPAANATATPSSGQAPLTVTLVGEAFDMEDSLDELSVSWDLTGNGLFEPGFHTLTPVDQIYPTPGLINVKLRVEDTAGAWDVDTVAIQVLAADNIAPVADLTSDQTSGNVPLAIAFDASGSTDTDDSIVRYWWDFDGDGLYEGSTVTSTYTHTYTSPGIFDATVMVEDSHCATDTDTVEISANLTGNDPPVADLSPATASGNAPYTASFDAGGSSDSDGGIVLYEWDFDGDGNYDGYGADATIDHVYAIAGSYTAKLRVTDDVGAQDTDTASVDVNAPPAAALSASPSHCNPGTSVVFSAAASTDSDGSIGQYEWDLDGNGSFETDTGTNPVVQTTYTSAGEIPVSVRVTDDDGAQDEAGITMVVHGWLIVTVDSTGLTGLYTSLALIDGCPAISYFDEMDDNLRYARATTRTGASASDWSQLVIVDSLGHVGWYSSLASVDGCPAISYYDGTNNHLKYARATTSTGASSADWMQVITADSSTGVGSYTSLAVVAGNPAIAYADDTNHHLKYARATTSTGASTGDWTQIVTVDSSSYVGWYASLAVVDGCPAISYFDDNNDDIKYARATTGTGANAGDWTQIVTVDGASAAVGWESMLAVIAGCPAICYYDGTNDDLKYARATTATGANAADWTQIVTVDSPGNVGGQNALSCVDGTPAISYFDYDNNELQFARSTSFTGGDATDWTQNTVVNTSTIAYWTSIIEIDGRPAISYYDSIPDDLMYAICF